MANGWNLCAWLECIGAVSGGIVRRYLDILIINITFPYSTCNSSFFGSSIPTSLFIFKMIFHSYFCAIYQTLLKEYSRSFKYRDHANMASICSEMKVICSYI